MLALGAKVQTLVDRCRDELRRLIADSGKLAISHGDMRGRMAGVVHGENGGGHLTISSETFSKVRRLDRKRLTQTYLEQISANEEFRGLASFFQQISYLHLIPQVIKYPEAFRGKKLADDPYGHNFLERVAATPGRTRDARLRKIDQAVIAAVPQLCDLSYKPDPTYGIPHLEARLRHWRPAAGRQREDQFSDGTLRLIGLLWSLLDGDGLLLLEEPELSLHTGIVTHLAPLVRRLQRQKAGTRQVLLSTHSEALLSNSQIDPSEVLLLIPGAETTTIRPASP